MKIAREGFRYIGLSFLLAGIAFLIEPLRWVGALFAGLGLFVAFFFRDPDRVPPEDPRLLVAPGDGRVVDLGPAPSDPSRNQIGIFLSLFDVHVNRSPMGGLVEKIRYSPGRFLAAYRREAALENERNEIELSDGDYRVTVRQIAGVVARRIVCGLRENDRTERGARIGLIQFGSRMEVVLPKDTEILVQIGDHVRGGETPIGRRS